MSSFWPLFLKHTDLSQEPNIFIYSLGKCPKHLMEKGVFWVVEPIEELLHNEIQPNNYYTEGRSGLCLLSNRAPQRPRSLPVVRNDADRISGFSTGVPPEPNGCIDRIPLQQTLKTSQTGFSKQTADCNQLMGFQKSHFFPSPSNWTFLILYRCRAEHVF